MIKELRGDAGTIRSEYVLKGFNSGVTEHQRVSDFILKYFVDSPRPLKVMRGTTGWTIHEGQPVKAVVTNGRVMTVTGRCLGSEREIPLFGSADDALLFQQHTLALDFIAGSRRIEDQRRSLQAPSKQELVEV